MLFHGLENIIKTWAWRYGGVGEGMWFVLLAQSTRLVGRFFFDIYFTPKAITTDTAFCEWIDYFAIYRLPRTTKCSAFFW